MENNDDICKCPCHEPGKKIIHCAPCCHKCPECGLRIWSSKYKQHILAHPGLNEKLLATGQGGYINRKGQY